MSTTAKKTSLSPAILEFKSSTFSVPVLVLFGNDLDIIQEQLEQKISLAPEFFKNSPVVFDLQQLNKQDLSIDIVKLVGILHDFKLLPIGIRGGASEQIDAAINLHIPVYSIHNHLSQIGSPQKSNQQIEPLPEQPITTENSLINHPIRSGQRVYSAGDLTVTAQVSAGAEILAEGNIHVYGSLRGRALAGVKGDISARIFCFDLQAELVSIAGNYKISEDLDDSVRNKPVQIYLQENSLIIKDLV